MACTSCGRSPGPHTRRFIGAKMETVASTYIPGTVMYETTTAYTPKEFEVALCDACLDRADRHSMRCGVAGGGCALLICTAILAGVATSPVAGTGLRWFAWIFAALL